MKPKEVAEIVRQLTRKPHMPAIHIWGPPGVGKSRLCKQIADEDGIGFIDMRLSMMDPSDIKGLPFPEDGRTKWLPPWEFPRDGKGIFLLDEFNLAPPLVQASGYQFVLDRKVGEYTLPEGWHIIAAGNRAEHGANIYKMAAPLRNRFIHIDFEVDLDDWRDWAINNNLRSEIVEFISFRPDLLFKFDSQRHDNAFPTPRTWEFMSQMIQGTGDMSATTRNKLFAGTVGDGAALEFTSYLQIRTKLPNIDEILAGKDHVVDNDINVSYALVTGLVIRARNDQFERLLNYSEKIKSKEVAILMLRLMIQKDRKAIESAPSWKKVSAEYFNLLF